jgi:hypothetical protein
MDDFSREQAIGEGGYIARRVGTPSLLSWGPVVAGIAVALVVQILLTMLGVGLGLAALIPSSGTASEVATISTVGAAWYVISGILAAFAGGYIAGRAKGNSIPSVGGLHGLVSWAATALIVMYLMTSAVGSLVGGAFAGVTGAIGGVGKALTETAGPVLANSNPLSAVENQVRSTGADPEAMNNAAVSAVQALVTGDEGQKVEAREQAATALARARSIPIEQARSQVADMEKQYTDRVERAKQTAVDAAQATAAAASTGALLATVALILGGVAGWFGGRSGARASVSPVPVTSVPS